MKKVLFPLFATAMSLSTQVSAASITGFSTEANYNAFVGAEILNLDFTGVMDIGSDGDFPGLNFNTIGATNPDLVNINGGLTDAGDPSTPNFVGLIQGVPDAPSFALAMTISSAAGAGAIELYDASNAFIGSAGFSGNGFVGIQTDMAFSSFVVNTFFSAGIGQDRVFINNVRINEFAPAPVVPLPASGLLLLGALGFLGLRRKRG